MFPRIHLIITSLLCCASLTFLLAGCRAGETPQVLTPTKQEVSTSASTSDIPQGETLTPSPTEIPLAGRVNGIAISLAEYQAELEMYKATTGAELTVEDENRVLEDLVDRALLAGAAAESGFVVDQALLDERLENITAKLGGEQPLANWISTYGFDEPTFNRALRLSIASAWMRDKIANEIPRLTEQVHARQILLYDYTTAQEAFQQLQSGNSFRNLALEYDPITGGDLGWFPRGYLPHPEVEEAVYNLQPEQYSSIIQTPAGFHIVQLLEKDPQHELSPDALLVLQNQALKNWLIQARAKSQIEVYLP